MAASAPADGGPADVVAAAILAVATSADGAPALRALLDCMDCRWPVTKAISQSTHRFDTNANACDERKSLGWLAAQRRAGLVDDEELADAARAMAEMLEGEMCSGIVFPVCGMHPVYVCLSAYLGILWVGVAVPLGLAAALLVDWSGVGIHRGLVQIGFGLCADMTTVERGPVFGYRRKLAESLLALGDGAARPRPPRPSAAAGVHLQRRVVRSAAATAVDEEQEAGWSRDLSTPELEGLVHAAMCSFAEGSSPDVAPDPLELSEGSFGAPALRHGRRLRLQVLGGGARRHEYDVSHLQMLRRFLRMVWACHELRQCLRHLAASLCDDSAIAVGGPTPLACGSSTSTPVIESKDPLLRLGRQR